MSVDLATNWLGLEPVLIERIRARVSGLALVGGPWEYDQAQRPQGDADMDLPAVFVLYGGHASGLNPRGRGARLVDQTWTVVLVTRPDPPARTDSLRPAGVLLSSLILALEGWPATHEELRAVGLVAPLEEAASDEPPVIHADGLVTFSLNYRARMQLN